MEDNGSSSIASNANNEQDLKMESEMKVKEEVEEQHSETEKNPVTKEPVKRPGYAHIKQEFVLLNYKPKIQKEFLSEDSKRKLADVDDNQEGKNEASSELEPPNKKTKLKGRNKNRPRADRIDQKDKLCPSVKESRECKYGDTCRFNHDIKDYFSKKPADIGTMCPVYEKLGYCKHGISCRWSSSHLGENLENLINEELQEKMKNESSFVNSLSEEVRNKLWKHKYDFKKTNASVKCSQKLCYPNDQNWSSNSNVGKKDVTQSQSVTVETPELKTEIVETEASFNDCVDKSSPSLSEDKAGDCSTEKAITITKPVQGEVCKLEDDGPIRLTSREVKKIDFHNKLYLAPLTTVGNLPFRRVCKDYGVDITCSEMALASSLLKAKYSEWSLIKRHPSEDIFGVQLCGQFPDMMTKCAQVLSETSDIDFIDINCGCPIDMIFKKGSGSALMGKATKLEHICRSMIGVMGNMPLTVKLRTGIFDNKSVAHNLIPRLKAAGVSLVTIHGRSREQRYTKLADWEYVNQCAGLADPMPVFGNGDILSFEDANMHMANTGLSGVMIARGALIKPWIFTEIKEQRHWDISSSERFDMLKSYTNYGLEHWGSDHQGVETTRRFMLEWISFLHRYIPVGVLEQVPQKINERPPYYIGRNDLETMMASTNCADWIKLSEMLLGPVPDTFQFLPKHKANAYQ